MSQPKGTYGAKTDIGRVRLSNEDQASVSINPMGEVLLVVCDGMGGANKGDYASKMALDTIKTAFSLKPKLPFFLLKAWITSVVRKANRLIYEEAENNPIYHGMGTTMVVALISGNHILFGNIGDSRAYISTPEGMKQVSEDQTYVNYLVKTGKITQEESLSHPDRHVLMNALGIYPSLSITFYVLPYEGQSILLCSDGLYNSVPFEDIHSLLSTDERTDQKVNALIKEANENGGSDNSGVALWEAIDDQDR